MGRRIWNELQETMKKTKALLGRLESLKTVNEETGEGYITFAALQERKLPAGTSTNGAAFGATRKRAGIFGLRCQNPVRPPSVASLIACRAGIRSLSFTVAKVFLFESHFSTPLVAPTPFVLKTTHPDPSSFLRSSSMPFRSGPLLVHRCRC